MLLQPIDGESPALQAVTFHRYAALLASHKELVEALKSWQDHLTDSVNCMDAKEQAIFFAAKAALSHASQLTGQ